MAQGRISGRLLKDDLARSTNLTFNTNTLVVDYTNSKIGIGSTPSGSSDKLVVNGNITATNINTTATVKASGFIGDLKGSVFQDDSVLLVDALSGQHFGDFVGDLKGSLVADDSTVIVDGVAGVVRGTVITTQVDVDNIQIKDNEIISTNSNGDITISPNGTGNVNFGTSSLNNASDPIQAQDVATKAYVDTQSGSSVGNAITLGTPTDASLTSPVAFEGFTTSTKVTDAIDDLNEVIENVRNNTFVKSVAFSADVATGGAGLTVTLTVTAVGNADRLTVNWGDGSTDSSITDFTPSHTYSSNVGSPYDVTVTAFNNSGSGSGSTASLTKTDFITIFTADPVVSFAAYAASSGGSPITSWDDGATIYFQNNTTNIGSATIQFTWTWGDGSSDNVISSDSADGGTAGGRLAHTFTASTETEQQRTVTLKLDSHSTANPAVIPVGPVSTAFLIFDTHTPTVTLDDNSGINESATSGHPVVFTNTTESGVGAHGTYGIQYVYKFGDGTSDVTVNAGSGAAGDRSVNLSHTFALSSSQQAAGTAVDFTGNLRVTSSHTSSPFISSTFTVHVEPDIRATIVGTAVAQSDASGDNNKTIYDHTTYDSTYLGSVTIDNDTQNANLYVYNFQTGQSTVSVSEDGSAAGSKTANLVHSFSGVSTGNYNLLFTATGQPDLTVQSDTDNNTTFALKAVPSAPAALSTKTLTLSTATAGTSPKLVSGFTDASSSNPLSAGASLATTTARRYTSGSISTNVISDFYNGLTGTLTASINGSASGAKAFSATLNETGTFTSLVVTANRDQHDADGTYRTGFYQVISARIDTSVTALSKGVNDSRLEHSTTGNSSIVAMVEDDMTATPTFGATGTVAEGTAGTKRFISGIPYYNSGSPTLTITGVTINNLTGQAYTDQSNIVEVDNNNDSAITNTDYTYANIDGSTTMLASGTPKNDIGVSSAYAIGVLTVPITSSSVRIYDGSIKIRARNVNGISSYTNYSAPLIQVHTASATGFLETGITVADALGDGFDDDAVRIFDFNAATTDTPSFSDSTNFYTNSIYSEASDPGVAGTREAIVREGVLKHFATDLSSGFLPVGPNLSTGRSGTQYATFAFRRTLVNNFNITITSTTGITGLFIAAPGTAIDNSSGLNGFLKADTTYAGSGVPGSDTGNGGNGSDGCASTPSDRIATGSALSGTFNLTLGSENSSNATSNVILVRIALASGESVTALSIT